MPATAEGSSGPVSEPVELRTGLRRLWPEHRPKGPGAWKPREIHEQIISTWISCDFNFEVIVVVSKIPSIVRHWSLTGALTEPENAGPGAWEFVTQSPTTWLG